MKLFALALAFFAFGCNAATYYVAKTGSNSNPGTSELPLLTVQKGVDTARAGDTVLIGAGTYAENVRTADYAGSAGAFITLDGQGVATVGSFSWEKPYIRLLNLTIKGGVNSWGGLLYVAQAGSNCVLSNSVVDADFDTDISPVIRWNGPASYPFGTAGSDNVIISNTIQNIRGEMVFRVYGYRNVISGNRLLNADNTDWFQMAGGTNYIVNNLCSNLFNSGLNPLNHADFFQTFADAGGTPQGTMGHLVESNIVMKADGVAQLAMMSDDLLPYASDITFRNNLFIGVAAKASCVFPNVKWYNNVFYQCATNTENGGPVLIFADTAVGKGHGGQVFNNVFLDCGIVGTTNTCGYYFDTTLTNVAADYNYVGKGAEFLAVKIDLAHRAVGDPGGWDVTDWWEPHGINGGDPLLSSGWRPLSGSTLIGAALPLNAMFTTDIAGVVRSATWDIGAYEYQSGSARATLGRGTIGRGTW